MKKSIHTIIPAIVAAFLACTSENPTNNLSEEPSIETWETAATTIGPMTYCLGFLKNGKIICIGSGFAINDKTIATNAHVVEGMREILTDYGDSSLIAIAVQNGGEIYGKGFFFLNSYAIHPEYDANTTETFDFGIVTTKTEMSKWVNLANSQTIQDLKAGMEVGSTGFPGELNPINISNPVATFKNGTISAVRAFGGASTTKANGYYIQHNLSLSGGTSGSPIFNKKGEVLAINNSGIETMVYSEENDSWARIPIAALGFGIRIDQFSSTLSAPKTLFASLKFERVYYKFINDTWTDVEIHFKELGVKDTIGWGDTLSFWDRATNAGKEPIQLKSLVATGNYVTWFDTLTLGKDFSKRYIVTDQYFLLGVTNNTNKAMRSIVVSNAFTYDSSVVSIPLKEYRDVGYYRSSALTAFRAYFANANQLLSWTNQNTLSSTGQARYVALEPSNTLAKTVEIRSKKKVNISRKRMFPGKTR